MLIFSHFLLCPTFGGHSMLKKIDIFVKGANFKKMSHNFVNLMSTIHLLVQIQLTRHMVASVCLWRYFSLVFGIINILLIKNIKNEVNMINFLITF